MNAAFADGRITLSWDAVTGSQHEGYIDPAQVTYNIYDSKGKQLARDIRETRYSFTIDMPEDLTIYSYVVKAVYSGNESEGGCSNDVILGSIRPSLYSRLHRQRLRRVDAYRRRQRRQVLECGYEQYNIRRIQQ